MNTMQAPLLAILGISDLWVIVLIMLLLFGSSRLPQLMRSLGASMNEFKKGMQEGDKPPTPPAQTPAQTPEQPAPGQTEKKE